MTTSERLLIIAAVLSTLLVFHSDTDVRADVAFYAMTGLSIWVAVFAGSLTALLVGVYSFFMIFFICWLNR